MKCFPFFIAVFCVVPYSWAAVVKTQGEAVPNPTLTTASAYLLKKWCGPIGGLLAVGVAQAAADGVKRYQESNDLTLATMYSAGRSIGSASSFLQSVAGIYDRGIGFLKNIKNEKGAKNEIKERTQEVIDYLKEEIIRNPNSTLVHSLFTGTNIALVWTTGPFSAWVAATLSQSAAEGIQKYKDSGSIKEASWTAAEVGHKCAADLAQLICGVVSSSAGLAKDLSTGKDMTSTFKKRSNQLINSIPITIRRVNTCELVCARRTGNYLVLLNTLEDFFNANFS